MKIKYLLTLPLLAVIACASNQIIVTKKNVTTTSPKNIIFLIGDGMGLTQLSAGTYAFGNTSSFEKFKTIGIHKPYSSDKLITDSAAGATAFASGVKTYNGAIGVDADKKPVKTILEEAEEYGLATGLIATSSITHATPACFIAHNESRLNYEAIAADFVNTEIDFFVGGGKKYFQNRSDERDLSQELKDKGYHIADFFDTELHKVRLDPRSNFGFFTANEEPLTREAGRDYLMTATTLGLSHLKNHSDKGFFMMIEGSQIDWGGHANNVEYVLNEWQEFDMVLNRVLEWAEQDGETLVIVTADHETGGLAIQPGSEMNKIIGAFTSGYHTGAMIPVFAKGPGEELFGGIYENTAIYNKMRKAFGW